MKKFQNYLKDVFTELKKVTWPSWDELKGATIAVIVFSALSAVYIYGVDFVLMKMLSWTSGLLGG